MRWRSIKTGVLLFVYVTVLSVAGPEMIKSLSSETVLVESYNVLPDERMGVAGFEYQRFIQSDDRKTNGSACFENDMIYWGGAGFGAVTGERGGYFIGGFILGKVFAWEQLRFEPQLFLGGGGGHGAPQGGGGIVRAIVKIGYAIHSQLSIHVHSGYIYFVNGEIRSPLFGISVTWQTYEIFGK